MKIYIFNREVEIREDIIDAYAEYGALSSSAIEAMLNYENVDINALCNKELSDYINNMLLKNHLEIYQYMENKNSKGDN